MSRDLEKRREYNRAYHLAHREEINERLRRIRRPRTTKQPPRAERPGGRVFRAWREQGCLVCGIADYRVIAAHHVDPAEKDRSVSRIVDVESVKVELAKCVPLCANHHILVHAALSNGHKGAPLGEIIAYLKTAGVTS